MLRRLHFVVPDESHAMQILADLAAIGIGREHVHAIPGKGMHLAQLPPATERQQHDAVWYLQRVLWNVNLGVFWIALAVLLTSIWFDFLAGALAAAAAMAATFFGGAWFAIRVPDAHLEEFRSTLSHGEILLMVDVPRRRVFEIEEVVERHHPEAVVGGTGWTIGRLGI